MNTATNYAEQQATRNAAKAIAAAQVKAQFPKLQQVGDLDSLRTATKNIRTELKAAFPAVKFTIKSSRYSGGDSVRIGWTDGPNDSQVSAIVCKYNAGSFDGMTDSYTYNDSAFNDVFGDARYVFTERSYSDNAVASAIRTFNGKFGECTGLTVEAFRTGGVYNLSHRGMDYNQVNHFFRDILANRTYALTK